MITTFSHRIILSTKTYKIIFPFWNCSIKIPELLDNLHDDIKLYSLKSLILLFSYTSVKQWFPAWGMEPHSGFLDFEGWQFENNILISQISQISQITSLPQCSFDFIFSHWFNIVESHLQNFFFILCWISSLYARIHSRNLSFELRLRNSQITLVSRATSLRARPASTASLKKVAPQRRRKLGQDLSGRGLRKKLSYSG